MTFDAKYEQTLDDLAAQIDRDDRPRINALPVLERTNLHAHIQGVISTLSVGVIFLKGFDEIAQNGELASKVPDDLKRWVNQVPRGQSGGRIAGMIAASICSVLEDYIVGLVQTKLTAKQLVALRAADPSLSADDTAARGQLAKRVKPSARAQGNEWTSALSLVFSISLTVAEADTLIDMIAFRSEYIHDPPSAFARAVLGEHVKCWTLAAMTLCHRLALS